MAGGPASRSTGLFFPSHSYPLLVNLRSQALLFSEGKPSDTECPYCSSASICLCRWLSWPWPVEGWAKVARVLLA